MIRCEHCGSMLPDGAIFCGECGRSVNVSANRRPAPAAPVDDTPPPPLRQPDQYGHRPDPAAEAWLPEATLDPATRAWLTGEDRRSAGSVPERSAAPAAPAAPGAPAGGPGWAPPEGVDRVRPGRAPGATGTDATGTDATDSGTTGTGTGSISTGAGETGSHGVPAASGGADLRADAPEVEPPLDPDAYPSSPEPSSPDPLASSDRSTPSGDLADTERTRLAPTTGATSERPEPPVAPVWSPPVAQQPTAAPSRPSWWVGRGPAAAEPPVEDQHDTSSGDEQPRAGDTAVVEPLVDRRPAPTPLIAPGSGPATCPVCGHALEPDDIFCAECGAVRPTVTAAFTGPVVPLPTARPDWAADDEVRAGGERSEDGVDGGSGASGPDDEPATATPDGDPAADGDRAADRDRAAEDVADAGAPGAGRVDVGDADGTRSEVEEPEHPHDGAAVPPAPVSPTAPSSVRSTGADVRDGVGAGTGGRDLPPVPRAAPLPPIPGSTGPVLPAVDAAVVPSSGDPDPDEDVEETRIVVKTESTAPFVLHFSTGERTAVHGTGLLGRLPRPEPAERFDDLLTVHDPGKSVSKTHLELGRDGDDLWVSDRHSGNGTVIRHIDGSIRRCEPGRRYRVERGARVDIGEQFFLVQ
ncbi:zinc-ribbon domain-containing protein [Curtobacterium oceanosedimentum]|uniref:zinc-ribbon domain-containing protein n=1 Tax=Curtobacterium oceanosedimentum TaxID=465820 RepID=UPI00128ECAD1|nr:zinc-ribbon domain-containing protein [Curtobacterium oceanosedimentum]